MLANLLNIFFPRLCTVCHTPLIDGEDMMCLGCLTDMPWVSFDDYHNNSLTERLVSLNVRIEKAVSMFHYIAKSPYVNLIHDMKYNRRPVLGRELAEMHARKLITEGFFDDIDVIIPVPLHFTRLWRRGYNQSHEIALGLSRATGIPVGDNLTAARRHATQTRKSAEQRRKNSAGIFKVRNHEELDSLHVLVVDDVITTGSTILSALEAISLASPTTRLSAYSLAMTKMQG